MTLTIQDKDELGLPISDDEEILHKAMKKAQEFTQTGIMEILEVDPMMWKEMCNDNPSRVRDHSPTFVQTHDQ